MLREQTTDTRNVMASKTSKNEQRERKTEREPKCQKTFKKSNSKWQIFSHKDMTKYRTVSNVD